MRAAVQTELTGPGGLVVRDVDEPEPAPGQVLVDVHVAGVSFPDLLRSHGRYQVRPELPFVGGWEVAGVVREDGGGFRRGDRVAAMPVVGGFAETVAVDPRMVLPLPDGVDLATGAALPLNYLTAHLALVRRGRLAPGETVLVHGAAGGVGSAVCDLASALGARVVAVVSTAEKGRVARAVGAHETVAADTFAAEVAELTGGRGVEVVVDPVGGERFVDSLRSLAPEGRLLVLGFTSGEIPQVRVNRLLLANTAVLGVATNELWRHHPDLPAEQWTDLVPLVTSGALRPHLGTERPLADAAAALAELESRTATGKLLLRVR